MKKYFMLTFLVAAAVLLSGGDASARGPRTSGGRAHVSPSHLRATSFHHGIGHVTRHGLTQAQWRQHASHIQTTMRGRYHHVFTPKWYAHHRHPWYHGRYHRNVWVGAVGWPALAAWVGIAGDFPYDYGAVYGGDTYYVTDETETSPVEQMTEESTVEASTEQDTQDPAELASQGYTGESTTQSNPADWMPLGVFTITSPNSTATPDRLFQFSINKNGQLAGSYYDTLSGQDLPIQGAVNKNTQRAAWTVGSNKEMVMETNLGSFTQNQANVLVHQGKDQTEEWIMVRLEGPITEQTNQPGTAGQTNPTGITGATSPTNP